MDYKKTKAPSSTSKGASARKAASSVKTPSNALKQAPASQETVEESDDDDDSDGDCKMVAQDDESYPRMCEISETVLRSILQEKHKVILSKRTSAKKLGPYWDPENWMLVELSSTGAQLARGVNSNQYPGLVKILEHPVCAICVRCYNNPTKSLYQAVASLTGKFNPTNMKSHMASTHKSVQLGTDEENKERQSLFNPNRRKSAAASGTLCSVGSSTLFAEQTDARLVQESGDMMMYNFMSSCNISARLVNHPMLESVLRHMVENASVYKEKPKLTLSRDKYTSLRLKNFANFVSVITNVVARV